MKHFILLAFCTAFLSCNSVKKAERVFGSELFAHWVHSHEEDGAGYRVFRRSDYAFPPSRGREGFEIKADGSFVHHQIGPVDAPVTVEGKWKLQGDNMLIIRPQTGDVWSFQILEVNKDVLKVK